MVRTARRALHAAGLHRRRNQPVDAAPFVPSESTDTYFEALRGYLECHGCPVAFYSDKHTVFRVNRPDAKGGSGMTQFGRALAELNIEIICANSSQAKGRVERANRTLQDRLVKELRLAGVCDMESGNAFCRTFWIDLTSASPSPLRAQRTCTASSTSLPAGSLTSCAIANNATSEPAHLPLWPQADHPGTKRAVGGSGRQVRRSVRLSQIGRSRCDGKAFASLPRLRARISG